MLIEVCANSYESAKNAALAGADRIELCSELGVGGVTPSYGVVKRVMNELNITTHVLIRPRSGNFVFSDEEFKCMEEDIKLCKSLGCQGVVSGVLNKDNTIDQERTKKLIDLAFPMSFTFHRAIDLVPDPLRSITVLENLGVHCVLSSGQHAKAEDGLSILEQMRKATNQITIMPGSGINSNNISSFENSGFKAVHFSAIRAVETNVESSLKASLSFITLKLLEKNTSWVSNKIAIESVIAQLKNR